MARKPVQFNWRRHWKKKIEPHLGEPLVQSALDLGMKLLDPNWKPGDPPHLLGRWVPSKRIVKGKLSWYQPAGRCHWIVFFCYVVGVMNYPHLRWDIPTGDAHTVAVGFDKNGAPAVVMDILLFDQMTAGGSLELAQTKIEGAEPSNMGECYQHFIAALSGRMVA
jgi:hypothetical protein